MMHVEGTEAGLLKTSIQELKSKISSSVEPPNQNKPIYKGTEQVTVSSQKPKKKTTSRRPSTK